MVELVEMVERLAEYLRPFTGYEHEGEVEAWRDARALLERYKPAVAEMSEHAWRQTSCNSHRVFHTDT